jgi:phosphate transport system protein
MMSDHTVKAYDEELHFIGGKLAEMGGIAEKMLVDAIAIRSSISCSAKSRKRRC